VGLDNSKVTPELWVFNMDLTLCLSSGTSNLGVASRILENLWIPDVKKKVKFVSVYGMNAYGGRYSSTHS
jgi:hypothetical protein